MLYVYSCYIRRCPRPPRCLSAGEAICAVECDARRHLGPSRRRYYAAAAHEKNGK